MLDFAALVTREHRCDWRMLDLAEEGERARLGRGVKGERCQRIRRQGAYDGCAFMPPRPVAALALDFPCAPGATNRLHLCPKMDGIIQHVCERVREFAQAIRKGKNSPFRSAAHVAALQCAADQGSVFLLQRVQLRKRVPHRKPGGVASVDATDERIDGVVEKLAAESAQHEVSNTLFAIHGTAAAPWLAHQAKLRPPRK